MKSADYKKGFERGYLNPSSFDQSKLMQHNDDLAQGVVAGICQRKQDTQQNHLVFGKKNVLSRIS